MIAFPIVGFCGLLGMCESIQVQAMIAIWWLLTDHLSYSSVWSPALRTCDKGHQFLDSDREWETRTNGLAYRRYIVYDEYHGLCYL